MTIKPNPPKDGDGKPRVFTSSEKLRNDSPKDPKIAGLPITGLEKGDENMECN